MASWMAGPHCAAEGRRVVAVTHLATARSQKIGNGISGLLNFMFEIREKTDGNHKTEFRKEYGWNRNFSL